MCIRISHIFIEADTYLRGILVCTSVHSAGYSKIPVARLLTESRSLLRMVLEAAKSKIKIQAGPLLEGVGCLLTHPLLSLMRKGQEASMASLLKMYSSSPQMLRQHHQDTL